MTKSLIAIYKEVNDINDKILNLINYRISLINQIMEFKDSVYFDYFDPLLEQDMLEYLFDKNKGPLSNEVVKEIFSFIFSASLKHLGVVKESGLLINSENPNGFLKIHEIFDLVPGEPIIIAGPCSIEKIQYLESIAIVLKQSGIKFLRGGAYKPRTSPYEFQGLKEEGLKMLHFIGKKYNLITVSEVVDIRDLEIISKYVDVIQIGARNMQNFELLKEVGRTRQPVLIKRGISATIQEYILAAEYIALQGNRKIILCERGIRTYETKTRNTLDISAIPILKKETSLPIVVDISHSLGRKDITNEIAKAVIAVGADGLMVEVHPYPELALSDSKQQLNLEEFMGLLNTINLNLKPLKLKA